MAKYQPSHLKTMNTKIVFREFLSNQSLFINEIARKTKISVPTVIKIVDFLVEKELLCEQECTTTKVGRKPKMLKLNCDKYFSIGILYEGEYLFLGIVDLSGKMSSFIQVKCGQNFEKSVLLNIEKLLEMGNRDVADLIGIGIGIPCIFDQKTRMISAPLIGIDQPQYFGDTIDRIAEKYHTKVVVDNDLNLQAYGEYQSRKPARKEDLIFISLGTGLGAGIVIDGKVRTGDNNFCGEIGYLVFDMPEDGQETPWLENKINLQALHQKFGISEGSSDAAKEKEAVAYVAKYLALIVNTMVFSYDVSNIVLDGYVMELLGDEVLAATQQNLNRICYKPVQIHKKNVASPGILGGALMASDRWLEEVFK